MLGPLGPRFFRSTFGSLFLGLGPVLGAFIEVIVGPEGPGFLAFARASLLATGPLVSGLLTLLMLGPILVLVGLYPSEPLALNLPPLSTALGADLDLDVVGLSSLKYVHGFKN